MASVASSSAGDWSTYARQNNTPTQSAYKPWPIVVNMADCQCQSRGSIHLIVGPMFSGKTTELFRLTKRHTLAGKRTIVVKYARDNRYDTEMACTHDMHKMEAISAINMRDVFDRLSSYDVIGIDEGQFFGDVVECSEELANSGKTVIIAALDGDFQRKPFPGIAQLFAMAEKIDKINAVCRACGHFASFTYRTVQSNEREVIGGEDMYQAVCRACYNKFHSAQAAYENSSRTIEAAAKHKESQVLKRMKSIENHECDPALKKRIAQTV